MGVHTYLYFTSDVQKGKTNPKGHLTIVAKLDIGYGISGEHYDKLIKNAEVKDRTLKNQIRKRSEILNKVYTLEGNYTESHKSLPKSEQKITSEKLHDMACKLRSKLPCFYVGDNKTFMDGYDHILRLVKVQDLREALIKEQAHKISSGEYKLGYPKYDMAISMCKMMEEHYGPSAMVVVYDD